MRRTVAILSLFACVSCASEPSLTSGPLEQRGRAVLNHLVGGDFASIRRQFDTRMTTALSETKMRDDWKRYTDAFGSLKSQDKPTVTELGGFSVVRIPVRMTRRSGEIRISYDADGRIAGLYFLKPGVPL